MNAAEDLFRSRLRDLVDRHMSWPIGPTLSRADAISALRAEALRLVTAKLEPPKSQSQYPKL